MDILETECERVISAQDLILGVLSGEDSCTVSRTIIRGFDAQSMESIF